MVEKFDLETEVRLKESSEDKRTRLRLVTSMGYFLPGTSEPFVFQLVSIRQKEGRLEESRNLYTSP